MRRAAALACAVLLAGCASHHVAPALGELTLPPAFGEPTPRAPRATSEWWRAFGDPRLDELEADALALNQDLAAALARLEAAESAAVAAAGPLTPSLDTRGQIGRTSRPGFFGTDTGTSYTLSLAAAYELDVWRRVRNERDAARAEVQASQADLATLQVTTTAQLADLYLLAVETRAQLALLDRTIASFAESVRAVEGRYRAGIAPALDLYQARQALAGARARRPAVEGALARAEHGVAVLAGKIPEAAVAGARADLPAPPPVCSAGIPIDLLTHRPDLAGALARLAAADGRAAAAIAARMPALRLTANLGRSSTAFSAGAISGRFWDLAAALTAPLLDGGRLRAIARARQHEREAVAATFRATLLRALQEVEDGLTANRTGELAVARTEERVAATAATLHAARDSYLEGVSDYLPMLTAQQAHLAAESDLLATRRELLTARTTLARALGGGWATDAASVESEAPDAFEAPGVEVDR